MTEIPARVELVPAGPLSGRITAPPSKSVTNRLLVVATLANGTSILRNPLRSDDTEAMATAVASFGADVEVRTEADGETWLVSGTGGDLPAPSGLVDARESGTTLRFLSGLAALAKGRTVLGGSPSLLRRPIGALVDALSSLGLEVNDNEGYPPLAVHGGRLRGGRVRVDASASSQFATALLLVAPYAETDLDIEARGLGAEGYVALTLSVMQRFGAKVEVTSGEPSRFHVSSSDRYAAREVRVEYDASAAAHIMSLAVASGGSVTISNAFSGTLQPDASVAGVLAAMGAGVSWGSGGLTVRGADELTPVEVDLSSMPDQLPTLAALAALARGTSRFTGLAVSRGHESDRVAAMATELQKLGARVREGEDWLEVTADPAQLHGAEIESHDDHRIAMSFTAVGSRVPGLVIRGAGCVGKTYPGFFADAARLGLVVTSRD